MNLQKKLKRISIDAAGYGLILLGVALGWLPGPGGIPLVVAGLGLLSINNTWARRLRDYLLKHGGKVVQIIFPDNKFAQTAYDVLVLIILAFVAVLAWRHSALWELSLAIALFFIAIFIAALNRDRYNRIRKRRKKTTK
jgi:lysylphosphatidylglycerol synthetase-like protein (DUF2156 family)